MYAIYGVGQDQLCRMQQIYKNDICVWESTLENIDRTSWPGDNVEVKWFQQNDDHFIVNIFPRNPYHKDKTQLHEYFYSHFVWFGDIQEIASIHNDLNPR